MHREWVAHSSFRKKGLPACVQYSIVPRELQKVWKFMCQSIDNSLYVYASLAGALRAAWRVECYFCGLGIRSDRMGRAHVL